MSLKYRVLKSWIEYLAGGVYPSTEYDSLPKYSNHLPLDDHFAWFQHCRVMHWVFLVCLNPLPIFFQFANKPVCRLSIRSTSISLLSINAGGYFMLCIGYLYQFPSTEFTSAPGSWYTRSFRCANAGLCFCMTVFIVVFCILGSAGEISGGSIVSTWVSPKLPFLVRILWLIILQLDLLYYICYLFPSIHDSSEYEKAN